MTSTFPANPGQSEGSLVSGRLADQVRAQMGLVGYSEPATLMAAVAELLARSNNLLYVESYGAIGDGATDDGPAIQAAITAAPSGSRVLGTPGKTYIIGSGTVVAADLLRTASAGVVLDFTGCTLKYGGSNNIDVGSDGGNMPLLSLLHSNTVFYGMLDCNSKVRCALGWKHDVVNGSFWATVMNTLEAGGIWTGLSWSVSADIGGTAVSGRAKNITGMLLRPGCPFDDGSGGGISTHHDVSAIIIGGTGQTGNATSAAFVIGSSVGSMFLTPQRVDTLALMRNIVHSVGNTYLHDFLCHDLGVNVAEFYGTSEANSTEFGQLPGELLAACIKYGAYLTLSHGNIGTDESITAPNVKFTGGTAQGEALLDFGSFAGAGGRIVEKVFVLTDAASIAVNAAKGNNFEVTVTAGRAFAAPTNLLKGQPVRIHVIQDGVGGHAITWDAAYVFGTAWSDTGNTAGLTSTVEFVSWDGTTLEQVGSQVAYH